MTTRKSTTKKVSNAAQAAENARLREALRAVVELKPLTDLKQKNIPEIAASYGRSLWRAQIIASEALGDHS